jgi:DNA-binding XRE family transcriptional regulator
MAEIAHSIDLDLVRKLHDDAKYRQQYFWDEASARIVADMIALRKSRGLNQKQVAEKVGTKQSAISRVEKAEYKNWNLKTLRSIADALDARLRITMEPFEEVLRKY